MKKSFPQNLIILIALLLASSPIAAQIDIEAVARLHFRLAADSLNWFEGFAQTSIANLAPYPSHRSEGRRDAAHVVRTTESAAIEWKTAAVPARWSGDSAAFVWVCGFGSNLGNERFILTINNKYDFAFSTPQEPFWRIAGKTGGTLAFTAVHQNHNGALFGYMIITAPASWLKKGEPLTIKISSDKAAKEIWYRTFAYTDALAHLRAHERKNIFSQLSFWNLGDATLRLVTRPEWAGQTVLLHSANDILGETILRRANDVAVGELVITRQQQNGLANPLQLQLAGKNIETIHLPDLTEKRLKAFLEEELVAENYVFPPGSFPAVQWKRPGMVDNELGKFELRVRYFDRAMNPVETAAAPGRYAAVVEGTTPTDFTIKRYVTLYCAPIDLDDYGDEVSITINPLPSLGIAPALWKRYEQNFRSFSFGNLVAYLKTSADAAIFLAGLSEMDSLATGSDSPRLRDRQWWITFKSKFIESKQIYPPLALPSRRLNSSSRELSETPPAGSPFGTAALTRIRQVCSEWSRDAGEPLITLVAYQGHVVFHEAFGQKRDGTPLTTDTPMWMASITKLLTGVLLMQFVDQGLIDLDAPVQQYLPEIKSTTAAPILTIRHLLTHTNGLGWHGDWGSDWNPALENYLAQCLPYLKIGETFEYNRLGYALAGKVLERLTGRAVPYLCDDYVFKPLHMQHSVVDNTYGSLYSTALDLAQLGQMLLNRGRYGELHFFSEDIFEKMVPQKLDRINPKLDRRWGIGTVPLSGNGLSEKTFGHEAASGAIFRIDPVNDLIIVSARNRTGSNYERHAAKLLEACTAPLQVKMPAAEKKN